MKTVFTCFTNESFSFFLIDLGNVSCLGMHLHTSFSSPTDRAPLPTLTKCVTCKKQSQQTDGHADCLDAPPSLNPPPAVDPVWPRGLYSGTGSLCSRTGLPFITQGRVNHVHNLFISIIIRHQPARELRRFKNICSGRRTAEVCG